MKISLKLLLILILSIIIHSQILAQNITGKIIEKQSQKPISYATIKVFKTDFGVIADELGSFSIQLKTTDLNVKLIINAVGFQEKILQITPKDTLSNTEKPLLIEMKEDADLEDVVVTGTQKEVSRLESPVPVEVYSPAFFKKNPTPSIFDALQNVNGVRPQLNCNICNTGDIHINGLEGPYTMVLIDGMPIVSSLSTVYGLSGIPNSLVERVEIVKGPASSLYGSEAVGGIINIITKKPQNAPLFSADIMATSWKELSVDLGLKTNINKKISVLSGINYFNFQNIVDKNNDNFTDMTLQHRVSFFQKYNFERKENRIFSLAGRYFYEDRWGGDTKWTKEFRGGDSLYGESIYTNRYELLGNYQLPTKEKIMLSFSYNLHDQDSRYGKTSYIAKQHIGFSQLVWDKTIGRNDFLIGAALRYTYYDDNTPATAFYDVLNPQNEPTNQPQKTWLPGIFVQNEIKISLKHKFLAGFRYDYNSYHGNIFTPRIAYKYSLNNRNILRVNAGTGFRVVNLFTEDHAALTGAREVEIKNTLNPEKSYNINLNYIKKINLKDETYIGLDASTFYTFFNNKIIGNYEIDPNKIIYDNLAGYAESKGVSLNIDVEFEGKLDGLKIIAGGTLMANTITENNITERQILTENFTGVWAVTYKIPKINLVIDYTGNIYSPMRLPTLGGLDPRQQNSPWWSTQNIQLSYTKFKNIEIYGGVKNLLNWTPFKENNPFIIAGAKDPFDKNVQFGANGQVLATATNPYGVSFDPNYIYAPTQGIRGFLGVRVNLK